eukprot:TRINITY_DN7114_c1_g1_i7.p1 TRINITY_DN7114_c1_g1~~TRINITY_DN7114_c1_g1_i7.p1  ORF type:complete len:220 (+),score=26.67 TRINITY_DN7114_c1_g1_i7:170-829(+)
MMDKPLYRYLDVRPRGVLCGRGGVCRLFMLANDIAFDEELVSLQEWASGEKARTKSEGINPGAYLPSVKMNGKWYSETIAICRYLARKYDLYGKDEEKDYDADALCDAYQVWRNTWATALGEEPESEKVSAYLSKREHFHECLEAFYKARTAQDGVFLTGGEKPGFADCVVYAIINDDQEIHGQFDLDAYPNLAAVHEAVGAVPEVQTWREMWKQRTDF